MKLAQLRKLPETTPEAARMRGTQAQDALLQEAQPHWRRFRLRYGIGGAGLLLLDTWLSSRRAG